jgi:glycosyltransferase involved in cell wall biosynthesis
LNGQSSARERTGLSLVSMPKVSIVIPNYNHARFLRQRIDTILTQTFQDFELILLDDCSTDESRSILREYASDPRVQVEFNDANSGSPFKQWNKGVRLARGKYIWIAESDDYADARLLERLVGKLEADPDVTLAYCRSWSVTKDNRQERLADWYLAFWNPHLWQTDFCMDGREMCEKYFCGINAVPNASSVVFRRDAYEKVGGADESLRLCGDWKVWAAMALTGHVAYFCETLNYFRSHAASVRNRTEVSREYVIEDLQLCRWVLDRVTVSDAVLENIRNFKAGLWVPALMSLHAPLSLKRRILQNVYALDPHPFRRVLRPVLTTLRLKIQRHWHDIQSSMGTAQRPGNGRNI